MFDIGIGEIILLVVAGLVVVGPERLPQFAAHGASLVDDAGARRRRRPSTGRLGCARRAGRRRGEIGRAHV